MDDLDKLLEDELNAELETKDDEFSMEDFKALQAQVDELNKEKHGLLKAKQAEVQKRQELSGRLNQLTETVNQILETRSAAAPQEPAAAQASSKGIPITFDDDGEAFLAHDDANAIVAPYQQRIDQLEKELQLSSASQNAEAEAERVKASIVGEDERYYLANSKYQAARKWVVDRVLDFQEAQGLSGEVTSGFALDYIFDNDSAEEFNQRYPGMNLVDVVTAEDSQHHFRTTLNNIAEAVAPQTPEPTEPRQRMDGRFQKVLNKPSGLGSATNAQAGALTITEKVGNLSVDDIMNLSDDHVRALEEAMGNEEKADGVKF